MLYVLRQVDALARTGQQHTDAALQNGVTRARYCPRQKRAFLALGGGA